MARYISFKAFALGQFRYVAGTKMADTVGNAVAGDVIFGTGSPLGFVYPLDAAGQTVLGTTFVAPNGSLTSWPIFTPGSVGVSGSFSDGLLHPFGAGVDSVSA